MRTDVFEISTQEPVNEAPNDPLLGLRKALNSLLKARNQWVLYVTLQESFNPSTPPIQGDAVVLVLDEILSSSSSSSSAGRNYKAYFIQDKQWVINNFGQLINVTLSNLQIEEFSWNSIILETDNNVKIIQQALGKANKEWDCSLKYSSERDFSVDAERCSQVHIDGNIIHEINGNTIHLNTSSSGGAEEIIKQLTSKLSTVSAGEARRWLYGLHQGITVGALEVLNTCYTISGANYVFAPSPQLTTLNLSKIGHILSFDMRTSVQRVWKSTNDNSRDIEIKERSGSFELNDKGSLEPTKDDREPSSSGPLCICDILYNVEIDLNYRPRPSVKVRLEVSSKQVEFRYNGPRWRDEIKKLENISQDPISLEKRLFNFHAFPKVERWINEALINTQQQIYGTLQYLLQESSKQLRIVNQPMLIAMIGLFDQVIKFKLIKMKTEAIQREVLRLSEPRSSNDLISEAMIRYNNTDHTISEQISNSGRILIQNLFVGYFKGLRDVASSLKQVEINRLRILLNLFNKEFSTGVNAFKYLCEYHSKLLPINQSNDKCDGNSDNIASMVDIEYLAKTLCNAIEIIKLSFKEVLKSEAINNSAPIIPTTVKLNISRVLSSEKNIGIAIKSNFITLNNFGSAAEKLFSILFNTVYADCQQLMLSTFSERLTMQDLIELVNAELIDIFNKLSPDKSLTSHELSPDTFNKLSLDKLLALFNGPSISKLLESSAYLVRNPEKFTLINHKNERTLQLTGENIRLIEQHFVDCKLERDVGTVCEGKESFSDAILQGLEDAGLLTEAREYNEGIIEKTRQADGNDKQVIEICNKWSIQIHCIEIQEDNKLEHRIAANNKVGTRSKEEIERVYLKKGPRTLHLVKDHTGLYFPVIKRIDEPFVSRTAENIQVVISSIQASLNVVCKKRNFKLFGFKNYSEAQPSNKVVDPVLMQYLRDIMLGNLNRDPIVGISADFVGGIKEIMNRGRGRRASFNTAEELVLTQNTLDHLRRVSPPDRVRSISCPSPVSTPVDASAATPRSQYLGILTRNSVITTPNNNGLATLTASKSQQHLETLTNSITITPNNSGPNEDDDEQKYGGESAIPNSSASTAEGNVLTENDSRSREELRVRIRYLHVPRASRKTLCCPDNKPEELAILWARNPIVHALNDGFSTHYSSVQFLKLYGPGHQAALWLMLSDFIAGSIGAYIGRITIRNPNQPTTPAMRIWGATTDALAAFIFTIGDAIEVDLAIHPEDSTISNKKFWSELMPVPLVFFLYYAFWHSLSGGFKERHFPTNSRLSYVRSAIDDFLRFALHSRIFQVFLQNCLRMPSSLPYQIIPCVPALLTTAINHSPRYRERMHCAMVYMMAVNFGYLFGKELVETLSEHNEYETIADYTRLTFWLMLLIYSTYFTIKNTVRFVEEYQGTPELIVQTVQTPSGDEYHELEDEGNTLPLTQFNQIMGVNENTQQSSDQQQGSVSQPPIERFRALEAALQQSSSRSTSDEQRRPLLFTSIRGYSTTSAGVEASNDNNNQRKSTERSATFR